MTTRGFVLFLMCAALGAQTSIAPPHLGFVEDRAQQVRPAYGVAGNFILGQAVTIAAISEAYSGSLGLLKTNSAVVAFDATGSTLAQVDAASGPALFCFTADASVAMVYVTSDRSLIAWNGKAFVPVAASLPAAGRVVALGCRTSSEVSLFVTRGAVREADEVWRIDVSLDTGAVLSQARLAGVSAPMLALPSGDLVSSDANGVSILRTNGSSVRLPGALPERFALQQMSRDWVEAADLASGARFAIHTAAGREAVYRLPE